MNLLHIMSISVSVLITIRTVMAKSITDVDSRVFYGEDIRPGEHKHLVLLTIVEGINNGTFQCSGSIINEVLIVTAAHCICDSQISFRAESYPKKEIGHGNTKFSHPSFKSCGKETVSGEDAAVDIGLLKTDNRIIFGKYVQPIEISTFGVKLGDVVTIAGYGETESGYPNTPKQASVTVKECDVIQNLICSYGETRTGSGDSGGPVTHNGELVGITSSGGCSLIKGCISWYTKIEALTDMLIMILPKLISK